MKDIVNASTKTFKIVVNFLVGASVHMYSMLYRL